MCPHCKANICVRCFHGELRFDGTRPFSCPGCCVQIIPIEWTRCSIQEGTVTEECLGTSGWEPLDSDISSVNENMRIAMRMDDAEFFLDRLDNFLCPLMEETIDYYPEKLSNARFYEKERKIELIVRQHFVLPELRGQTLHGVMSHFDGKYLTLHSIICNVTTDGLAVQRS